MRIPGGLTLLVALVALQLLVPWSACGSESVSTEAELRALWRFDEGAGDILFDETPNANHGTVHAATWVARGSGLALRFDGTSTFASIPDSPTLRSLDRLTITFWINPERTDQDETLLRKQDAFLLKNAQGRLLFQVFDPTVDRWSPPVRYTIPAPGAWYFVVVVYNGTHLELYVCQKVGEGEPVGIALGGTVAYQSGIKGSSRPVYIGGTETGQHFQGLLDEVRIYGRVLSEEEIGSLCGLGGG